MKRTAAIVIAVSAVSLLVSLFPDVALAADASSERVVAMYFHRTQRCPTCQKMGAYSEEAVKSGFARQLKDRTVAFHYIDFQDKKNAAFTKGYGITGPDLVVARITNNKVAEYKNLKDIWAKVRDKKAFVKYVQDNVTAYCNKTRLAKK